MLVLSRKEQEQLQIGDCVTVTVIKIRRGCVRIGIDAPHKVPVLRGELSNFTDSARADLKGEVLP